MTDVDIIEGDVITDHLPAIAPRPTLAVTPQTTAAELVARLDVIREAMHTAMVENIDYGKIPGATKPSLFKPGAEKLGVLFQLDVQVTCEKTWGPGDHLTVESKAVVYHAPTGIRLGSGEGMCSTREKRYAKRLAERTCPHCGVSAIIKGKQEFGGGWVCFRKKNGCGAKFPDGDPVIEGQSVGEVENPDLPDLWNSIVKMGKKRAHVDAVLAATGASALFTQDVEDQAPPERPQEASVRPVEPVGDLPPDLPWEPPTEVLIEPGTNESAYARTSGPADLENPGDDDEFAPAHDLLAEIARQGGMRAGEFRDFMTGLGLEPPSDLGSAAKRQGWLSELSRDDRARVALALADRAKTVKAAA